MIFTTAFIALVASLPAFAAPAPVAKRAVGVKIRAGRDGTCLSLASTRYAAGNSLVQLPCDQATSWDINRGSGSIFVSGTNQFYALDAGSNPGNNGSPKIWTSYPGLYQQTWYYTDDNRIAITGGDQCLDLGDNGPQTYQCTPGNTNQVWFVDGGSSPSPSPSSTTASSTTSSVATTPRPSATSVTLLQGYSSANSAFNCLTVDGTPGDGTPVIMSACAVGPTSRTQAFNIPTGSGPIQLVGTNYCLDAGSNPANGIVLKLWTCYSGLPQQTWTRLDSGLYGLTSSNQCLDVKADQESVLQTWTCSNTDLRQQFQVRPPYVGPMKYQGS